MDRPCEVVDVLVSDGEAAVTNTPLNGSEKTDDEEESQTEGRMVRSCRCEAVSVCFEVTLSFLAAVLALLLLSKRSGFPLLSTWPWDPVVRRSSP